MLKNKQTADQALIIFQILLLTAGLIYNALNIIRNYYNLSSPLIPEYIFWEITRMNFLFFGLFILAFCISWIIVKKYNRKAMLILIFCTILSGYFLLQKTGEVVVDYGLHSLRIIK